jgi:opacity protein-like surface antigen
MMKRFIHAAAICAAIGSGALVAAASSPALADSSMQSTAPKPGANSFTEAQAKDRIEKAGFSSVGALTKNGDGIWVGKASKDGSMKDVMLDYQGNVTSK